MNNNSQINYQQETENSYLFSKSLYLYNIFICQFESKNEMGLTWTCQSQDKNDHRFTRKTTIERKSSMNTCSKVCQSKIILQSLRNKIKASDQNYDFLSDFRIISELGRGSQADIFQIKLNTPLFQENSIELVQFDNSFVLRKVCKNSSVNKKQSLGLAKNIKMKNECLFIMNGVVLGEDQSYTYQIMEMAKGGDLRTYLGRNSMKQKWFRSTGEEGIKFLLAGIVIGLQHLHKMGIIYCDLKLQNVLITSDGYPALIDFDMVQKGRFIKSKGYRGTPTYAAPELFIDENVDHGMDIWSLGVLLYALTFGQLPYSKQEVYDQKYALKCVKNQNNYKLGSKQVSTQLKNLINQLLIVNPRKRLGYCNFTQIKGMNFFKGFDWYNYQKKQMQSPFMKMFEIIQNENKVQLSRKQSFRSKRKQSADRSTQCGELIEQWAVLNN